MNYDEAIARAEEIVRELEKAEALSMDTYKQRAEEVKKLLDYCEQQLRNEQKNIQ